MEKLTIKDMKKIAHEIVEQEEKENNFKCDVFPVTFVEYYTNYVFKERIKLNKRTTLLAPMHSFGFNNQKGKIILFLNQIKKIKKIEEQIFELAQTCYHECRHTVQKKKHLFSYEGFMRDIESFIRTNSKGIDYHVAYDRDSSEIGARLYGVHKAKNYLKQNYPELYENQKEKIEKLEKRYELDYMTYDASDTFDRYIKLAQINHKIAPKVISDTSNLPKERKPIDIFLNDDRTFKPISEIINHEKFKLFDKKIVYAIFSCKSFLESINMEELAKKELLILNESLEYTSKVYENQAKYIEESQKNSAITKTEYLKIVRHLLQKIDLFNNISNRILKENSFSRDEKKQQEHKENIPKYLEKSKRLIREKSQGYSSITTFYIVGIIISLTTIIYLLIIKK